MATLADLLRTPPQNLPLHLREPRRRTEPTVDTKRCDWEKVKKVFLAILKAAPFFCVAAFAPPLVSLAVSLTLGILCITKNRWLVYEKNAVPMLNGLAAGELTAAVLTMLKITTMATAAPLICAALFNVVGCVLWALCARRIDRLDRS